jgi:hypothetical protein
LHQLLKGLMQRGIEMAVAGIQLHNPLDGTNLLDAAFKLFRPSRQSDRVSVPIATFPRGISNLSKMQGQEYPALVVQLMAVLAADVDSILMPRAKCLKVIQALDHLYRMWIWLSQEELELEPLQNGTFQRRVEM